VSEAQGDSRESTGQVQVVQISRTTPRAEALLGQVYTESMLVVWALVYWFFILGGATLALVGIGMQFSEKMPTTGATVMLSMGVAELGLGWWLRQRAKRTRETRRRALIDGVPCPARLKHVRPAIGLKITFLQPDYLHTFDVQMPDSRVVEHRIKLPLDSSQVLDKRDDLFALVHEASNSILIPETLCRRARLVD
jgi:hypothetical protein